MFLPIENDAVAERGRAILSLLGSFWTEVHGNKELFRAYSRGVGEMLAQRFMDYLYTVDTLSRKSMPVYRPIRWRWLQILESDFETSTSGALKYGESGVLYGINSGDIALYTYGGRSSVDLDKLDVDEDWVHCSILSNTPVSPSVALVHGTDFWFERDNQSLVFRSNPFDNPAMPITTLYDEAGEEEDRQITLWAFDCYDDVQDMSNRFGLLVGLEADSSLSYNRVVNAAIDGLTSGMSHYCLREFLCATAGIHLVKNDEEIVQDVVTTQNNLVVTTNRAGYLFHKDASAVVSVGDIVHRGDILCDTVRIYRRVEDFVDMPGLTISRAFSGRLRNSISFPNEERPVTVSVKDEYTKLSVSLLGDPVVIDGFWESVHQRGISEGSTLAELLDVRTNPTTQPTSTDLPATVNPFKLLLQEMLGEFMIAWMVPATFMRDVPTIPVLFALRNLLPARLTCLVLVEQTPTMEYIGLNDVGDAEQAGAIDSVEAHSGATLTDTAIGLLTEVPVGMPGYQDKGPFGWIVNNPCA